MRKSILRDSVRVNYATFPPTHYHYSNGVSLSLYKIALFNFTSSSYQILTIFLEALQRRTCAPINLYKKLKVSGTALTPRKGYLSK